MRVYLGKRYGRLVVTEERQYKSKQVQVRCDCGTVKIVKAANLDNGKTNSCGCLKAERNKELHRTHGCGYEDYRYRLWRLIKRRCFNPACRDYADYGGRGITMYAPWINDFPVFAAYLDAELGPRPKGATLDRIDNDGDYEPGKIRWASRLQQAQNRRDRRWRRRPTVTMTEG